MNPHEEIEAALDEYQTRSRAASATGAQEGDPRVMRALNAMSVLCLGCVTWFLASLGHSLFWPPGRDPLPLVGYLMLCRSQSLLIAT